LRTCCYVLLTLPLFHERHPVSTSTPVSDFEYSYPGSHQPEPHVIQKLYHAAISPRFPAAMPGAKRLPGCRQVAPPLLSRQLFLRKGVGSCRELPGLPGDLRERQMRSVRQRAVEVILAELPKEGY